MTAIALVVGGVLWTLAGFLWIARRDAKAYAARFEGLTVGAAEDLEPGRFGAIAGEVSAPQPVDDPESGEPVAWWEARLERIDDAGRRVRLLAREEGERLRVDGVEVRLGGAEIDLPEPAPTSAEGIPDDAMRALLEGTPHALPPPDETRPTPRTRWELTVRRIAPGNRLTAIGVPVAVGSEGALALDPAAGPVILSPRDAEEIARDELASTAAMDRMLALALVLGAAAFAVGVILALA